MQIIFASLLPIMGWIVVIFIGLMLLKVFKPFLKGKFGEFAVTVHAKKYLSKAYILLNNCTLPDDQIGTTQIDHILLSPYGIFIIETKNYKGWIFGTERQKMWTQKIFKNSYQFQNPLHQNYKHQKVLEAVLSDIVQPEYLHSVIVFMPECEFKTQMPANVFRGKAWTEYVKSFKNEVISPMKLKRIQLRIEKEILEKSWKTDRLHVSNLQEHKAKNDD